MEEVQTDNEVLNSVLSDLNELEKDIALADYDLRTSQLLNRFLQCSEGASKTL
jgi:hypothetical protein